MSDHQKSLSDCQHDAVILYGMLRGLFALQDLGDKDAQEGANALVEAARDRAALLAEDLDRVEKV